MTLKYKAPRLVRQFRGLPRDHAPRTVPVDININEPDRKFIFAAAGLHVNGALTSDYGGVPKLTDFHVFLTQGTVPSDARRSFGDELGVGFYPAA